MKKFIHCGDNKFNIDKFEEIKNVTNGTKPNGGLWASEIDDKYGWLGWCEKTGYNIHSDINNSFTFSIKDDANIVYLEDFWDVLQLPLFCTICPWYCIDFEECINEGIDAIYTKLYTDKKSKDNSLVHYLEGWDCNSIVILNKDIIVV